jgi:hypothetical protein
MAQQCLDKITRTHIIDIKCQKHPSPLVEKVMSMLCMVKGYADSSWKKVLEVLNPLTLKMELSLLDVSKIKKYSIFRIYNMIKSTKGMTVEVWQ